MAYTLAMSPDDEALIERYAARENLSVPDFMLRAAKKLIESHTYVPRPKVYCDRKSELDDPIHD